MNLEKKTEVAILISDKANLKPKLLTRNKEGNFILMYGITHQEHKTARHQWLMPAILAIQEAEIRRIVV
jgi:hypothetical protein